MSDIEEDQSPFIEDGHKVVITWHKDSVTIGAVVCPNEGIASLCNRMRKYCVVERFISVYGTECNVGSTIVNGPVEVAWAPVPGASDLDDEFMQIWVVPLDDPDYLASKRSADDSD